jgi:hypothetical protein
MALRTAISIGFWNGKHQRVLGMDGGINFVRGWIEDKIANQDDYPAVLTFAAFRLPKKLGVNRYKLTKPIESKFLPNGQKNFNVR